MLRPQPEIRRVLVVEDEVRSQRLIRANLEPMGYRVVCVERGEEACDAVVAFEPEMILLDLMLPGWSGYRTLEEIRRHTAAPVIIISARDQIDDKVKGLQAGADDYLVKPYAIEELLARMDAVARRQERTPALGPVVAGCIVVYRDHPEVLVDGVAVDVSAHEYGVLAHLAQHINRVVVSDALLAQVWGGEYRGDYGILHVTVSRLRKKLGPEGRRHLITRTGVGYMLTDSPTNRSGTRQKPH